MSQEIDNLIETLEILRDAIVVPDREAFEAVTIPLLQCMDFFGRDEASWNRTLPLLEQLKNHILAENFDEAEIFTLAFLAKFRATRKVLISAGSEDTAS